MSQAGQVGALTPGVKPGVHMFTSQPTRFLGAAAPAWSHPQPTGADGEEGMASKVLSLLESGGKKQRNRAERGQAGSRLHCPALKLTTLAFG